MKTFAFSYTVKSGAIITGTIQASSRREAIQDLKNDDEGRVIILSITEL